MPDAIKHGDDEINVEVKVVGWPDRPGIARIYLGGALAWEGANIQTSEVTLKVKLPYHIHFVPPELSVSFAWTEEPLL